MDTIILHVAAGLSRFFRAAANNHEFVRCRYPHPGQSAVSRLGPEQDDEHKNNEIDLAAKSNELNNRNVK
jgi:hypothetical protein